MIGKLFEQIQSIAELGGPVVVILIVLSVISLAVATFKLIQFTIAGVGNHDLAEKAVYTWSTGAEREAQKMVDARRSLLERTTGQAMRARHNVQLQNVDEAHLEHSMLMDAEQGLNKLERGFRILDSIAQIAPLLGLFGTVLGMIEAFQKLQDAGNSVDPSILAGGIWVALLTTAVGLAVAMPTSLFLTYFESRVARERLAAEVTINRIITSTSVSRKITTTDTMLTTAIELSS